MPLLVSCICVRIIAKKLFIPQSTYRTIMRAKEVILNEKQLERKGSNSVVRGMIYILLKAGHMVNLEQLIILPMKDMLAVMGSDKNAESELAIYVINGFMGALPILVVPILTGFNGYYMLYPLAVCLLIVIQFRKLKKEYCRWQLEIIRDIPSLIDKLRISFASGRDYITAFSQAYEFSGPKMKVVLNRLLNDLQYMRPAHALDTFAGSLQMPIANKFAAAVKIAIEHGYDAAENYFQIIEKDITEIRKVAIEELTLSKPEKIYRLYLIMILLAIGALAIKGWEIFSLVNEII